jgi:quercetin dioxygenase-like cupin family protein
MAYTVFDTSDVEGRRKPVAQALGAVAIKANQFDSEPGQEGHAHDELRSDQEEFFVALAGSGHMVIDGETVAMQPGRYVLVEPAAQRQVVAGPQGLSYLVVGARVEAAQA